MAKSKSQLITIRLSVANQKVILDGLKVEVKKTKLSRNKCAENILLTHFTNKNNAS